MNRKERKGPSGRGKKRIMTVILASALMISAAFAVTGFAGSSLLSPGTSKIIAGDSFSFTLNLGSDDSSAAEVDGTDDEFGVTLSFPSGSDLSVKEGVGSINAVTGDYYVESSKLGSTRVLHFTLTPPSDITQETEYTISVSVTGSKEGSDSFTLIVVPNETNDDSSDNSGNISGNNGAPGNAGQGGMPSKSGARGGSGAGGSGSNSGSSSSSVTYAGSWDNYLDDLSVEGYEFTRDFNKTRDTYFVTVPNDVTSLSVSADPSDSSAVVAITGNTELPEGRSKIMINVTADDGSVRIYRIYVDRTDQAGENDTSAPAAEAGDSEGNAEETNV